MDRIRRAEGLVMHQATRRSREIGSQLDDDEIAPTLLEGPANHTKLSARDAPLPCGPSERGLTLDVSDA